MEAPTLESAEFLVARRAHGGGIAGDARIGLLLEQSHGAQVKRPQLRDLGQDLIGKETRFERAAAGMLDELGEVAELVGAELARMTRPAASRRCIACSIRSTDFSPSSRK